MRENTGRMLAIARRFLRSDEDAADAVQDAFLSAIAGLDSFRGESSLSTWLHRIVANVCLMKLRSRRSRETISLDAPAFRGAERGRSYLAVGTGPEQTNRSLEREETRAVVRSCIDRLPRDYRAVLLLRDIRGLDTGETAQALAVSESVVKTRLHRARHALRPLLERAFSEPRATTGLECNCASGVASKTQTS